MSLDRNTILHCADIVSGLVRLGEPGEIEETLRRLAASTPRAEELAPKVVGLWKLLDAIDTLDDAAKGDDSAFRKKCYELQRTRFLIVSGEEFDKLLLNMNSSRKDG